MRLNQVLYVFYESQYQFFKIVSFAISHILDIKYTKYTDIWYYHL